MQYMTATLTTMRSVTPADAMNSAIAGLLPLYGRPQLSGVKPPMLPTSPVAIGMFARPAV